MRAVDRRTDHFWIFKRISVFVASLGKPRHQIGDRAHARRRLDDFVGLADALAYPGEIKSLTDISSYSSAVRRMG